MEGQKPIADVIDDEMRAILGAEGFEFYTILCKQHEEARQLIEQDFVNEGQSVYHDTIQQALAEGLSGGEADVRGARAQTQAWNGIRERRDRRLAEAYRDFQQKRENLFAWTQNKRPDCTGCSD